MVHWDEKGAADIEYSASAREGDTLMSIRMLNLLEPAGMFRASDGFWRPHVRNLFQHEHTATVYICIFRLICTTQY